MQYEHIAFMWRRENLGDCLGGKVRQYLVDWLEGQRRDRKGAERCLGETSSVWLIGNVASLDV